MESGEEFENGRNLQSISLGEKSHLQMVASCAQARSAGSAGSPATRTTCGCSRTCPGGTTGAPASPAASPASRTRTAWSSCPCRCSSDASLARRCCQVKVSRHARVGGSAPVRRLGWICLICQLLVFRPGSELAAAMTRRIWHRTSISMQYRHAGYAGWAVLTSASLSGHLARCSDKSAVKDMVAHHRQHTEDAPEHTDHE